MIKIDGGMSRFIFLVSDVSIFSVYSPLQMLFFRPMYLQDFNIHYCRCSFGNQRICNLLFFELADAFQPAYYINCIYILPFLGFEDTAFSNFASTSHIFDNMRMLPIKILHPACSFYNLQIHPAEITHLQFHQIHYRRYPPSK